MKIRQSSIADWLPEIEIIVRELDSQSKGNERANNHESPTFFALQSSLGSNCSLRFRFLACAESFGTRAVSEVLEKVRSASHTDNSTSSPAYANVFESWARRNSARRIGNVAR